MTNFPIKLTKIGEIGYKIGQFRKRIHFSNWKKRNRMRPTTKFGISDTKSAKNWHPKLVIFKPSETFKLYNERNRTKMNQLSMQLSWWNWRAERSRWRMDWFKSSWFLSDIVIINAWIIIYQINVIGYSVWLVVTSSRLNCNFIKIFHDFWIFIWRRRRRRRRRGPFHQRVQLVKIFQWELSNNLWQEFSQMMLDSLGILWDSLGFFGILCNEFNHI